jgi:hypothetical protein
MLALVYITALMLFLPYSKVHAVVTMVTMVTPAKHGSKHGNPAMLYKKNSKTTVDQGSPNEL